MFDSWARSRVSIASSRGPVGVTSCSMTSSRAREAREAQAVAVVRHAEEAGDIVQPFLAYSCCTHSLWLRYNRASASSTASRLTTARRRRLIAACVTAAFSVSPPAYIRQAANRERLTRLLAALASFAVLTIAGTPRRLGPCGLAVRH